MKSTNHKGGSLKKKKSFDVDDEAVLGQVLAFGLKSEMAYSGKFVLIYLFDSKYNITMDQFMIYILTFQSNWMKVI